MIKMEKMIENKMDGIKERKEMKERNETRREIKCLIWNNGKVEISKFPPVPGTYFIKGTVGFNYSNSFLEDITEIIKRHTIDELLQSGLISIFISKDELVFRNDKYIHTKELNENDIVIKFSLRKTHAEQDIVSTPAKYWLAVGEAFVYKKTSAPAHSTPAPRLERRGDRQVRISRR